MKRIEDKPFICLLFQKEFYGMDYPVTTFSRKTPDEVRTIEILIVELKNWGRTKSSLSYYRAPSMVYLISYTGLRRFLQTAARLLLDSTLRLQFSSDFYRIHDCIGIETG